MKKFLYIVIGVVALSFQILPASAVTADEAVKTCKKNKNCKITDLENGETSILVNGEVILCPIKGACQCITCQPPKKNVTSVKQKDIMSVEKLLTQGSAN